MSPAGIRIRAHAKVNLLLEILRKRPDGYHDIRSILLPITLHDEIRLEPARNGEIETVTEFDPAMPEFGTQGMDTDGNLTTRAARALREFAGGTAGVRIRLKKRVPIASGLGGGSSDAASTLVALNRMWDTRLDRARLMEIGSRVGSDIPALLYGGAVCMEGRGERVRPLLDEGGPRPGPGFAGVIVYPGFGISTRDVYERCTTFLTSPPETFNDLRFCIVNGDVGLAGRRLFNGFEPTVFDKYPLLAIVAEELGRAGAVGRVLCGSGSSMFGLARDDAHAEAVRMHIVRTLGPSIWCRTVRTLPDGVMVAHGPLEARV